MQMADFNHNDFTQTGTSEADKSLLVKFFMKPRQDMAATKAEGRPIYKEVEYVDIKIPGNRSAGVCRPASDLDRKRFPEHYRRFLDRMSEEPESGTPLIEWPPISRSLCEELAFFHVKTVEQLAYMSDTQCGRFMGLFAIREQARVWLDKAKKEKPFYEMEEKIKQRDQEIEELKNVVAKLVKIAEGVEDDDEQSLNESQKKRRKIRAVKEAQKLVDE